MAWQFDLQLFSPYMLRNSYLPVTRKEIGMRRMLRVAALLLLSITVAHAGTIYACKSVDGSATYQDTPCLKGASVQVSGHAAGPVSVPLKRASAASALSSLPAPPPGARSPTQVLPYVAPLTGAGRVPFNPVTFSPAEWTRAAGDTPWRLLAVVKGDTTWYAFTAHDYGALLSIKTISARTGMVFLTGRVDCHPGVDNDHLSNATGSVFDPATGTRLVGDFLLDPKRTRIKPGTVLNRVVFHVCAIVRVLRGEVSHPSGKGRIIKPDSNPSPLVSSMLAGLVEGNFRLGPHHDVHTTACPSPHTGPLAPPAPPFAQTDIAQYVVQADSGDTGALQRLRQVAASGNTLAAYSLGKLYGYGCHDGRGVDQDFGQAVHWYTLAAEEGHEDSQDRLSLLYSTGQGVPKDPVKARYWGDKSLSQSFYHTMIVDGRKVSETDAKLVFARVSKRAAQPDAVAQDKLGDMYLRGFGVTSNVTVAMQWYRKAAMQGNAQGQRNLALAYAGNFGQARNENLMLHWLTLAARNGDAMAAYRMGKLYYGGGVVLRDPAQAAHWFAIAADEGYGPSQYILATMYSRGLGVPRDDVQAIKWFLIELADIDNVMMPDNLLVQSEARVDAAQVNQAQTLARQWWNANANKEHTYPR